MVLGRFEVAEKLEPQRVWKLASFVLRFSFLNTFSDFKTLLPSLFKIVGLDDAKEIIERVIHIAHVNRSRGRSE